MSTRPNKPPIIIIGMHRSGTTMVTRLLKQLGLFVGAELEDNSESLFFLRLNEWIMQQCGAAWDHPKPIDDLLAQSDARSLATGYFRSALNSKLAMKYLGLWNYLRLRTPLNLESPWGWKDPRNTFTLPLWLDLFPDARVIHVLRHGVDVAQSLRTRSERGLKLLTDINSTKPRVPNVESCLRDGITDSLRCLSLEGGFSLWEEYTERARSHVASLGERAMEIRFEELLDRPEPCLRTLAEFCNLSITADTIHQCHETMVAGRAFAYRSDEVLVKFAEQHAERLMVNDYLYN